MRRVTKALVIAGVLIGFGIGLAAAEAAEATPLKLSGQPVTFAYWDPQPLAEELEGLTLAPDRVAHYEALGIDYVYGLYRMDVHFLADGDVDLRESQVHHLLSQSAIRNYGNENHWVDAFSENATIRQAETRLADGTTVEVDPATLQIKPENDDDIFSDSFEIIVPFAGLEPGATTVLSVSTHYDGQAYPLPFSLILYPQVTVPVERFEVHISWDAAATPPVWQSDFEDLNCQPTGERSLQCLAEQVTAYPEDSDILYADTLPTLVIGEQATWPDLAATMSNLVSDALAPEEELDQALAAILDGASDRRERLTRIHEFVSRKIRYLGLEHGLGGIVPRDTALTYQRRFGDCKDKTTLFIDLARRAGFDAYPVLTSTTRQNPDKLLIPATSYFNHMVACIRDPNLPGLEHDELCLDLTDPHSAVDSLSDGTQGAIRLDATGRTQAPHRLPQDLYTWTLEVETKVYLNLDGSVNEEQLRTYSGPNATWIRGRLLPKNQADRRNWLLDDFEGGHGDETELLSVSYSGVDEPDGSVTVRALSYLGDSFDRSEMENYTDWESDFSAETSWIKTDNEHHDYHFEGVRYRSTTRYLLPRSYRLLNPGAEVDFVSQFGSFRRRYEEQEGELVVSTNIDMPRALIPLEKIPQFNAFVEHLLDNQRIVFDVEAAASGS